MGNVDFDFCSSVWSSTNDAADLGQVQQLHRYNNANTVGGDKHVIETWATRNGWRAGSEGSAGRGRRPSRRYVTRPRDIAPVNNNVH